MGSGDLSTLLIERMGFQERLAFEARYVPLIFFAGFSKCIMKEVDTMEIKKWEPNIEGDNRNYVVEACKWVSAMINEKVKERDLRIVTASDVVDILHHIENGVEYIATCEEQYHIEDKLVDVTLDLIDVMTNNYSALPPEEVLFNIID